MLALLLAVEDCASQHRQATTDQEYEAQLLAMAAGDSSAFEQFYRATDRMLYAYALSLTGSHHDAQDIMMDAYLKIRDNAHRYAPRGKPLAWVFTIVRNQARSLQRDGARELPLEQLPEPAVFQEDAQLESLVLQAAMTRLNPQERQIVVLHAVSGLKHRELAQLLELPLPTVLSKYARAIAKLKKVLTEQEVEPRG